MQNRLFLIAAVFSFVSTAPSLRADQFHYQNLVIGDRAIGLGGAYGGISDDASGVFYNPAGAAFALSNDISGSANAMYMKKVIYKKTIGTSDFKEESGGTVPSFFGGLLKIDHIAKGLVLAWGIYALDSELVDQNDQFHDQYLGPSPLCANGLARPPDNVLKNFHRNVSSRGSTEYVGAALGWRISNRVALGLGANYVKVDELTQEYQDVQQASHFCKTDGGFSPGTLTLTLNVRERLVAYGVQPIFGIQATPIDRLSLGFTAKKGVYLSQNYEQTVHRRKVKLLDDNQASVVADPALPLPVLQNVTVVGLYQQGGEPIKVKNPLGAMSDSYRLGLAYFATTRLLLAADIAHTTAVKDADKIGGLPYATYSKNAVTNYMAGMEYYLLPAVPLRLGLFTNNDARPSLVKTLSDQRNHVDYVGGTFFVAWVQPNSQIGAGVVLQSGKGEAQKIGGSTVVQEVEGQSFTFAFSATTTL